MSVQKFLTPILAATYSRSGSTLLMQLLTSNNEVAAERDYPYEARYLTYFMRWCMLPFAPEKRTDLWNGGHMMGNAEPLVMGAFPWNDKTSEIVPTGGGDFPAVAFRALWEQFSARCGGARFYAEKTPLWVVDRIGESLAEYRTIFLVRDPRDVWLSINSFDKKRGFYGFGRKEGEAIGDYRARFIGEQRERFAKLGAMEKVAPTHRLVRYEDLVADLKGETQKLSDWLGVQLSADAVIAQRPTMAHHITSGETSTERWRREMPEEEQAEFEQVMGAELRMLYPCI